MVVNISCYLCILLYIQIILLNTTSVVLSYNKKKVLYSVQYMANCSNLKVLDLLVLAS